MTTINSKCRSLCGLVISVFVLCLFVKNGHAEALGVKEKISKDADLSQFYVMLENDKGASSLLMFRQVTVFVPNNEAFQKRSKKDSSNTDFEVQYHMTNLAKTLNELGTSVLSEMDGNPPLWITRRKIDFRDEIFVNNALILKDHSYAHTNSEGKKQVMHVISEVLEPVVSMKKDNPVYNPTAFEFLNRSESLNLGTHRVRSFRQRIMQTNKADIYSREGRFTFFIPVDEGFKPPPRPEKIDQKVIDGHVIPDEVLFTAATPKGQDYRTLAFGDMIRVTISFTTNSDGKEKDFEAYVRSNTELGDRSHTEGVVLAEIVKANIPVKNGVIHLIHRPLMVVDNTVKEFLVSFKGTGFEKEDGPLRKFYEVILDFGGDYIDRINRMGDLTLFAPSNEAWEEVNFNSLASDRAKMREILNLHLVSERLTVKDIMHKNINQLFQVPTAAERKNLYFNLLPHQENQSNQSLTVEGGGVNATVIQADIAATNGYVHIIDKVLGVPYTTIKEKLATDPMLNKTYHLGERSGFNRELDDTTRRYTYFVPRDYAWQRAEVHYPSAHKKLFMHGYNYHVIQILERHLVVADKAYTMANLKVIANETTVLPTMRDHLRIKVKESDKSYYIDWQGEWIHVFRPDVECTNGIIHVIDTVFLKASDIQVNGMGNKLEVPCLGLLLLVHLIAIVAIKWLSH